MPLFQLYITSFSHALRIPNCSLHTCVPVRLFSARKEVEGSFLKICSAYRAFLADCFQSIFLLLFFKLLDLLCPCVGKQLRTRLSRTELLGSCLKGSTRLKLLLCLQCSLRDGQGYEVLPALKFAVIFYILSSARGNSRTHALGTSIEGQGSMQDQLPGTPGGKASLSCSSHVCGQSHIMTELHSPALPSLWKQLLQLLS